MTQRMDSMRRTSKSATDPADGALVRGAKYGDGFVSVADQSSESRYGDGGVYSPEIVE